MKQITRVKKKKKRKKLRVLICKQRYKCHKVE